MSDKEISLRSALELAVATEERGGKYYVEMAEKFAGEKPVAEIFTKLAKDEANHEAQFKTLLSQVEGAGGKAKDDESYHLVRAAALSRFFDKDQKATDDIQSPRDALAQALDLEKSTLFYYQSIKDAIGGSPELDALIAAEKGHVVALTRVIISDAKFRGLSDPW